MSNEFCVRNIDAAGVRLRLLMGWVGVAAGLAAGWMLLDPGMPRLARLTVFLPALIASQGFLQAREKT